MSYLYTISNGPMNTAVVKTLVLVDLAAKPFQWTMNNELLVPSTVCLVRGNFNGL